MKGGRFLYCFLIIISLDYTYCQLPEIHQAALLSRFTGIYSFLGSYIAARELYFLVALVTVLLAGSTLLAFFQLPNFFLPVHHIQRSQRSNFWEETGDTIIRSIQLLEEKW